MKKLLWLSFAGILVFTFGTIYVVAQQSLRSSANDPQVQIAEDTAEALDSGAKPEEVVTGHVNLAKSTAPFVIIYDKQGNPLIGNGALNDKLPQIPLGVLQHANGNQYHAVTWEPQPNIRLASVAVAADNYYVLSGRSLRNTEERIGQLTKFVGLGLVASLFALLLSYQIANFALAPPLENNKLRK